MPIHLGSTKLYSKCWLYSLTIEGFMEVWSLGFPEAALCGVETVGKMWSWEINVGRQGVTLMGLGWVLATEVEGRTGQQFSMFCLELATASLTILPKKTRARGHSIHHLCKGLSRTHSTPACHHRMCRHFLNIHRLTSKSYKLSAGIQAICSFLLSL